jgi:hypothetical protein
MLIEAIESNKKMLLKYLRIKEIEDKADYHRIIYHYVYERHEHHAVKLDNYVALYGFLRSIALISSAVSDVMLYRYFFGEYAFTWNSLVVFIVLVFVTYIFFLAFIKFYRRFTLESYMGLVTDITYKEVTPTKSANIVIDDTFFYNMQNSTILKKDDLDKWNSCSVNQ